MEINSNVRGIFWGCVLGTMIGTVLGDTYLKLKRHFGPPSYSSYGSLELTPVSAKVVDPLFRRSYIEMDTRDGSIEVPIIGYSENFSGTRTPNLENSVYRIQKEITDGDKNFFYVGGGFDFYRGVFVASDVKIEGDQIIF